MESVGFEGHRRRRGSDIVAADGREKIRLHRLPPDLEADNRIEWEWQDPHAGVDRSHLHRKARDLFATVMRWLKVRFTWAERHVQVA